LFGLIYSSVFLLQKLFASKPKRFYSEFYSFGCQLKTVFPFGLAFVIIAQKMAGKKKKTERSIFDSIRKPVAPPSQKIGKKRVDEKLLPSRRKAKHKKQEKTDE
jgi:hypothetical protein